jgi:aspartyl-tRNA synthetase
MLRTHECGALRAADAGNEVTLTGWVHHRRDHGHLAFVDLRDASGTVQVLFPPDGPATDVVHELNREYCIRVTGAVQRRKPGTENEKLPTGEIEVVASEVEVLAPAQTPPFLIEDGIEADENLRLKYRYLDLRRPQMQRALKIRHGITSGIRRFLDARNFIEIETPSLTRSTPEGARDFLVPSRLQPGAFYALPQSPQLFKQLLMVSALERYYQIARCWRDEDLRADRQLEFTQLDLEMSFIDETDVQALMEELFQTLWREVLGVDVAIPFARMTYDECMARFGSDKPDVRYGMELTDVRDVFADTQLGIFRSVLDDPAGAMLAIGVPGGATMHKNELRRLEQLARERGAGGLAWFKLSADGTESPLAKHLTDEQLAGLKRTLAVGDGDAVLMVADKLGTARTVLGALRTVVAEDRGLIPEGEWKFLWMTDPPLFEWDEDEQRWVSVHHPFTSPQGPVEEMVENPGKVKARAYDIVLNGYEVGGGSIRIHRRDVQERVLEALKRDPREFDFLLEAFGYGPPPHGGIALGIDRLAMLMSGASSIREVIAFPKTQSGSDPMTGAPTPVDPKQLGELGLKQTVT